ncbi:hypothetical protein K490DRAFT_75195 [Saccharata proteae CBS 121410]|uniref:PDZ GRASP-type domain-containing protein n=1 Tax=Saccharata proteae CBS 121410 TaxID=1314787 RepID=A0A9P4LUW2_9PEZI|nr:hypothetical protein K490DRAFT_75195 [Saccharata proteae CBS 121410]
MFGALNRFISRLDAEPQEQQSGVGGAYGFQVLRNSNLELPLEPWFDFIIGINGRTIDNPDPALFATEVRNCAGNTISLGIWCAKGQRIREMYVPIPADAPSLGISLQWTPLSVAEDVWHILDVQPNSPADLAGLLPYGDYVIGSPEGLVRGESGLGELVEDYLNRPLRLHVYNHEYNVTRPITITPTRTWGGQGALGCVLGFGAIHRLPPPLDEPPPNPGDTLFEAAPGSAKASFDASTRPTDLTSAAASPAPGGGAFLVPAEMAVPMRSPPLGSPGAGGAPAGHAKRKPRAHHAATPASGGLDDYFKEGEQKSRELDYGGSGSRTGSVPPPPPKVTGPPPKGGPPKASSNGDAENVGEKGEE